MNIVRSAVRVSTLAVWLVVSAGAAPAQQPSLQDPPPPEPQLRIDPGMHTSSIRRIGVDAACSLMVTGSEDKTVRLWRLPEGKLLNTLRLPIGPGNNGKVYAVTLAPDGSWAAAGGWNRSPGDHWVYIFQSVTGAMMTRLGPIRDVINHLTVSSDGRFLAAVLGGGKGLRVWEKTGQAAWTQVAADEDYGNQDAYGAAFDGRGMLYTVADDGKLRRYAAGYNAKPEFVATQGGKQPFSVAVHPSNDRVAVGFDDTTAVEVFDAAPLARRFAVDTKGLDRGDLSKVAWAPDGSKLYAAGRYGRESNNPILVWDREGQGTRRELPGAEDTVMQLLPCADGIAMGASGPAIALYKANDERRLTVENVQPDLRGKRFEHFTLSADGRRIRFGLKQWSEEPVLFDLGTEGLSDSAKAPSDLYPADTKSLAVTDWINARDPKFGGKMIAVMTNETSRSLAIAPDKTRFVLGTNWRLRTYDSAGVLQWQKQVPGVVWGVHIPRDGKMVVAAYGDGTIRWHRLSDGQELLALFVHAKDRRWVLWTPAGYYMASPGAEALIGWHVNRGWNEAAQFHTADRFRDQFNRPDIVKLALQALDESKAIEEANKRANVRRGPEDVRAIAPPVIVIQKPSDNASFRSQEVTLEYYALSPTGKRITDIDVRVNNASLASRSAAPLTTRGDEAIRMTLTLPPEDVMVTLVAREGNKASEPVSIRLRWDGAKPGQVVLPRLRAVFVGVNDYASPDLNKLKFAAKDATDLAAFFAAQQGKTYSKVDARVLPNAKRADVLGGLEWLEKESEEGDINLLFLAGHGMTDDQQHFYYLAADSDPDKARATGVSRDEILRTIRNRKGAMVVMLDTCHSGATSDAGSTGASRVDMNRLANELGDKTLGVFLYASALGRQSSFEHADWKNGAFTRAMIDGLSGAADREKLGYVETDELAVYVRRQVMRMTNQRQEPVRMKPDAAPEMRLVSFK